MSKAYDLGKDLGKAITSGISKLRFLPGGDDYDALIDFPYQYFMAYEPSDDMILRGKVRRVGREKWCAQSDLRLTNPPSVDVGWKLFRDSGEYDYMREEYCLKGFPRRYNGKLYVVIADRVDDATPPPNNPQSWQEMVEAV